LDSREGSILDRVRGGSAPLPFVSMRGITKRFPNVIANATVDLDLFAGEVHALLGENGAGKSTLMKILYGFYAADSGAVRIQGEEVRIRSPHDARNQGIGMVFQSFTLIQAMTVAENIALYLPGLPPCLNARSLERQVGELGERYNLRVDPRRPVHTLAVGDQQKVEILKLLAGGARILIFDEATSVLAPHEIEDLFGIFSRLKSDGYSIVFITHKLCEVLACADTITVMRRGRIAGAMPRGQASEASLVALMFGDSEPRMPAARAERPPDQGQPALELLKAGTRARGTKPGLTDIRLRLDRGEIVGVAGVSGNGQRELVDVILGLSPCDTGTRMLFGEDATTWSAKKIREAGVGFVPDDPLAMAVVPWMSLPANTALGNLKAYSRSGGFRLAWDAVATDIASSFEELGFEALPLHVPVKNFSGGQVQRTVLARELGRKPALLVALYPTRGLDVHSAAAAGRVLLGLRNSGAAVLLVSEDLDELYSLCDRLVVIHKGRLVGDFRPDQIDRLEIGHLMTGSGGSA